MTQLEQTRATTTRTAREVLDEARIHAWRHDRFRELGFPGAQALRLADEEQDWHAVEALLARGCSPALAWRIVR